MANNLITRLLESAATGLSEIWKSTDGAAHTYLTGGMDSRGNYPTTWYVNGPLITIPANTTPDMLIYELTDASLWNYFTFENLATTDAIKILVSLDGVGYTSPVGTYLLDALTGKTVTALTIPVGKVGVLEGKFRRIKVLRQGSTNEEQKIRFGRGVM